MSTCTIPYLQNFQKSENDKNPDSISDDTIAKLEEIDIDIKSKLNASGLFTTGMRDGIKVLLLSQNPKKNEEQLKFINEINKKYHLNRTKLIGTVYVDDVTIGTNTIKNVVITDVRVLEDANLSQSTPEDVDRLIKDTRAEDLQSVLESFLVPPFNIDENIFNVYATDEEQGEILNDVLDKLSKDVEEFQFNFTQYGNNKDLKFRDELYKQLNYLKILSDKIKKDESMERISDLSLMIITANNIIGKINYKFKYIEKAVKKLESETNKNSFSKKQQFIGEFFTEFRELQHIFSFLEEFYEKTNKNKSSWENTNTYQFEMGLLELVEEQFPENTKKENREWLKDIFSDTAIGDLQDLVVKIRDKFTNENKEVNNLFEKILKIQSDSKRESKSILATINESYETIFNLKKESYQLQLDFISEILDRQSKELYTKEKIFESDLRVSLYNTDPSIIKIVEAAGLTDKVLQINGIEVLPEDDFFTHFRKVLETRNVPKDSINEIILLAEKNKLNSNKSMYYADKATIRKLLVEANRDIDLTDRWFEQATQYDDAILGLTATLVQRELLKGETENRIALQKANLGLADAGISLESEQKKEWEGKFVQEIKYIGENDELELATEEDIALGNFIELEENKKGVFNKYKIRRGKAFVTEYNKGEFVIKQKLFVMDLPKTVNEIFRIIREGDIDKINDIYDTINYTNALDITYTNSRGETYIKDQFNPNVTAPSQVKDNIQKKLYSDFFYRNLKSKDNAIDTLLSKTTEWSKLEELLNENGNTYFRFNTYERKLYKGGLKKLIEEGTFDLQDLKDYVSNGNELLVKIKEEEEFKYKIIDLNDPSWKELDIVSIFKYSGNLQVPINKNSKWESLSEEMSKNDNMKKYYNQLIEGYKKSNDRLGTERLRHYLINIAKQDPKTALERLSALGNSTIKYVEGFKFKEENTKIIMIKNDEGKMVRADRFNRILRDDEPDHYRVKQYLSGQLNKSIYPTNTSPVSYEDTEENLFLALHLFDSSTTAYEKKKQLEPMILTLKTLFAGDTAIGIPSRKVNVEASNKTMLAAAKNKLFGKVGENSARALVQFSNNFIYGDPSVDYNLGGLSVRQITNTLKALANFQVLANNIIASGSNLLTGKTNNFLLAQGKKFGLSEKILSDAGTEYWKNTHNFIIDSTKTNINDQSEITQLIWFFDAIKGDMVDLRGQVIPKSLSNRVLSYDTLFLSTSLAEHANQVPLMLAILKGFKVGDTNLRDIIEKKDGQIFEFNWEKAGIAQNDEAAQIEILTKVLGNIEAANYLAHGQYSKYSKSEIQRDSLLSMAMVFSNWIYPSLKVRYGKSEFVRLAGEFVDDGYQRQFVTNIFSKFNEALAEISVGIKKDNSLKGYIKTIISKKGIGALSYGLFEVIAKQAGFVADRISYSNLSKNSEKFNEWLYGNSEYDNYENKRIALIRASSELTFLVGATLLGLFLHALNDDDEEEKSEILKALELFTARYTNDTGQFLFVSSPSSSLDYIARKVKDPFALTRQFDTNTGLLSQLFGWDINYDDGFDFNLKFDDRYAKSGAGYEKGDLKIERKLMKSVFSPLYQLYRFGDLDQQLNYTKLLNKNSASTQTKVSEEELEQFAENREE
jgi:hypothetical protein